MPDMDMKNEEEKSPLANIIERVDSYIEDPKMVTKDTLKELRGELEDLRGFMDDEDEEIEDEPKENMEKPKGKPSLVIAIGKPLKEKKK